MQTQQPLSDDARALLGEFKTTIDGARGEISNIFTDRFARVEDSVRQLQQKGLLLTPPGTGVPLPSGEFAGQKFCHSAEFRTWSTSPGQRGRCAVSVPMLTTKAATNIISTTQAVPGAIRLPDVYGPAWPLPAMLSLIPVRPTAGDKVTYLRLNSRPTPGARSQFPEGSTKAEQSFDVGPVETDIVTIACWTTCTTQVLADVPQLEIFIDGTLVSLTMDELDRQILLVRIPIDVDKGSEVVPISVPKLCR